MSQQGSDHRWCSEHVARPTRDLHQTTPPMPTTSIPSNAARTPRSPQIISLQYHPFSVFSIASTSLRPHVGASKHLVEFEDRRLRSSPNPPPSSHPLALRCRCVGCQEHAPLAKLSQYRTSPPLWLDKYRACQLAGSSIRVRLSDPICIKATPHEAPLPLWQHNGT
jgi:hypothetical protein